MDGVKHLIGSKSRDLFKYLHKQFNEKFYALDVDLEWVEVRPKPFIVARIDFKKRFDQITFTEAIAYNHMVSLPFPYYVPVFIVQADKFDGEIKDVRKNKTRITVYRYIWGEFNPTRIKKVIARNIEGNNNELKDIGWKEFEIWEYDFRLYRKRKMYEYYSKEEKYQKTLVDWSHELDANT